MHESALHRQQVTKSTNARHLDLETQTPSAAGDPATGRPGGELTREVRRNGDRQVLAPEPDLDPRYHA